MPTVSNPNSSPPTCSVPSYSQLFPLGTRVHSANPRAPGRPTQTLGAPLLPAGRLALPGIARVLGSQDCVRLGPAPVGAAGEWRSAGKDGLSSRTSQSPEGPAARVAGVMGAETRSGPLRRSAGRGPGEGRARRADLRCAPAPAREPDLERSAPAGPQGAARRSLQWPRTLLLGRGRRPSPPVPPAPSPRPGRPPLPAAHLGRAHLPPGAWAPG